MPDAIPISPVSRVRRWIRGCRVLALFVLFVVLVPFIYLNLIGLPDFIKRPIAASVQRQGIDLKFETMRLFPSGIVVEKVVLEAIREKGIPKLVFNEVLLDFDFSKILNRKLEVKSLRLRKGRFEWPLQITNRAPKTLLIDGIGLDLQFLKGDRWKLDRFLAKGLGGRVRLAGTLSNASYLRRDGPQKSGSPSRSTEAFVAELYRVVQVSEQLLFSEAPEISIRFDGDARNLDSFKATIDVQAGGVSSPGIAIERVALTATLNESPATNSWISWNVFGRVEGVSVKDISVQVADVNCRVSQCLTNSAEFVADWTLQSTRAKSSALVSDSVSASGHHAPVSAGSFPPVGMRRSEIKISAVQPRMLSADPEGRMEALHATVTAEHIGMTGLRRWELTAGATAVSTRWGRAATLELAASSEPLKVSGKDTDPLLNIVDGTRLLKELGMRCQVTGTDVIAHVLGDVEVPRLESDVEWRHPVLRVRNLSITALGGVTKLVGDMDWDSRACHTEVTSTIDPLALWQKIDPTATEWSKHVQMEVPPEFRASAWFTIPQQPARNAVGSRWGAEWQKSLVSTAELKLGSVDVRGVRLQSLEGRAAWSNSMWSAPWFEMRHSNGWVRVSTSQGESSNTFQASLSSEIHPGVFKPWFDARVGRTLDSLSFGSAPKLNLEASGDWRHLGGVRASGFLEAEQIGYQSNRFDRLTTRLGYSDSILRFDDLKLRFGEEKVSADSIVYDIPNEWLSFTNGNSSMAVLRVTRLIGPKTTEAVKPYQFEQPPRVRVWGGLKVRDSDFTDMHFEVDGDGFSYWRFHVPQIAARVDWVTNTLAVSNVRSSFYQGRMKGDFFFDFRRVEKGEMRFDAEFEKADLRTLLADLSSPTNRAEGVLEGKIAITSGLSSDLRSWVGRGDLKLEQGSLWNVPLFSILSPVLNVFSPGLGSSRGGRAQATFQIRNGRAHTDDLQMQEPVARLLYRGWVDLDGSLSAKVEAEPLGSSWFPGRVLSLFLTPLTKLFEYKVTGTLGQPRLEPLYLIPKVLLFPLNPIENLKDLFPVQPKTEPKSEPNPGG